MEWLCSAFGFEVAPGPPDFVPHARLKHRTGMIMLSSHREDEFAELMKPPSVSGIGSAGIYVVVTDPDAHHAGAVAAGARIVKPLVTQEYGGRDYTCTDLEGHLWSFGTYDPWAPQGG